MTTYYDRATVSDKTIIEKYKTYLKSLGDRVDRDFLNYICSLDNEENKFKIYKSIEFRYATTADITLNIGYSAHSKEEYVKSVTLKAQTDVFNNTTIVATPNTSSYTDRTSGSKKFYFYDRPVSASYIYHEDGRAEEYVGETKHTATYTLDARQNSLYTRVKQPYADGLYPSESKIKSAMISEQALRGAVSEKK